jgi:UDP-N-acetylmuramate dehydrogenase
VNREQQKALSHLVDGKIQFSCSMADHTTFKVGGRIEALVNVEKMENLQEVVPFLQREGVPFFVLGRGSNLLVMDGDIPGVALELKGAFAAIQEQGCQEQVIMAGAGVSIGELLEFCRSKGHGGTEFLAGIPGTVGGASVMNAGAFGKDMSSLISGMEMVTPGGGLEEKDRSALSFSYRKLEIAEGGVVTRVRLKLEKSTTPEVAGKIKGYLRRRKQTQPLEYPSAGSIFRNPPEDHAGRLLEEAGLKGEKRGGAMISTKHANWIVNTGGASAQDILDLIAFARETVSEKTGIELELEIRVIG